MMRRLLLIAFLAVLCLGVGLVLSYGGEDSTPKPARTPSSGVWKDPASGLTWQVSPTGGLMNWSDAKAHCKSLHLDRHNDWRLPTITELRSLIRACPATQTGGPVPGGACWPPELSGEAGWYWSSSAVADNDLRAWLVDFGYGDVYGNGVDGTSFARCVR
jgi:hypothetical protein